MGGAGTCTVVGSGDCRRCILEEGGTLVEVVGIWTIRAALKAPVWSVSPVVKLLSMAVSQVWAGGSLASRGIGEGVGEGEGGKGGSGCRIYDVVSLVTGRSAPP